MQDTRERETVRQNLIGPSAKMRKPKVAYGTQGVKTKVPESKLTLQIALKLEKELKKRGYDVYMIRRKQNVNISNKQRAIRANKRDRKSTRLNSSHIEESRMPSSA